MQDGVKNGSAGVALEGQNPRGHLIKHHAEGKKIGAGIEFFAQRLLGRHISHRAHGAARAGERLAAFRGQRGFGMGARLRNG